jgi:pyruvate/2-oxoglutarate dehydrogenase complex dihydrolipoamide acyltransferase (E2) component
MAIELKMPALSPTMEEGTLAKWLVKEGDEVTSGTILAEIETDKATMEFESIDEGIVTKILVAEGTDEVKVGTVIAILNGDGRETGASEEAAPVQLPSDQQTETGSTGETQRGAPETGTRPSPRFRKAPRWSAPPSARRCATRWRRKCAPTIASS